MNEKKITFDYWIKKKKARTEEKIYEIIATYVKKKYGFRHFVYTPTKSTPFYEYYSVEVFEMEIKSPQEEFEEISDIIMKECEKKP